MWIDFVVMCAYYVCMYVCMYVGMILALGAKGIVPSEGVKSCLCGLSLCFMCVYYVCMHAWMNDIGVCMSTHESIYIYIYIYIYTHTHTHMHIYTY